MHPRIRDLRQDKDPNQTQIAKLLGMSQTGYSKYETGENDIPTAILIKPARFYNTSKDGEDAVATRGRNGFGSLLLGNRRCGFLLFTSGRPGGRPLPIG